MFSSRLAWDLTQNRLTRLLESKRLAGTALLDLTESNPTRARLPYPRKEIIEAMRDERCLSYDPHPLGLPEARQAVTAYYDARGKVVDPERVVLASSTSEAYSWLFKLLADPGDVVLVPRPSYPLFDYLASLESLRARPYELAVPRGPDSWRVDLDSVSRAAEPRARALIVVNPNNPTGSFLKSPELGPLLDLCEERGLAVISDEVFSDYPLREDPLRVESLAGTPSALTFALGGLSKAAGLPQMKLAWIAASGPEPILTAALSRLELIADTYLSPAAPGQLAAARLLDLRGIIQGGIRARLAENLAVLQEAAATGEAFRTLDVEGGWYAILRWASPCPEEELVLDLLERHDLVVHPGYFFDFPEETFLVISLLTAPETFAEGMRRLIARP
jgi:hypothetical protein